MKILNNMKLLAKVALPVALLVIAIALVVWQAKTGLDALADRNRQLIDVSSAALSGAYELLADVNEASIQEKNIILEQDDARLLVYRARFDDAVKEALAVADRLAGLTASDEGRRQTAQVKSALVDYFAVLEQSVTLGVANRNAEAQALSQTTGRDLRMKTSEAINERIARIQSELQRAKADAEAFVADVGRDLLVFAGVGILFAVGLLSAILIVAVSRPIGAVTRALGAVAAGDLDVAVVGTERRDEVGELARALDTFKTNALEARRLAAVEAAETEAKVRRAAALDRMTREFEVSTEGLIQTLTGAATELEATATSMTATAEQTTRNSSNVATAAEQTSANVQTVATATEELATSIREIARQVSHSSTIAGSAVESAKGADGMVKDLAAGAEAIGNVVALINTIAAQTNLLALNATIEAARAGEAGKGFAVVASEVKALAAQTTKATDDIAVQVTAIQSSTERVVEAIRQIGSVIDTMAEISTGIAAAVEEQGVATEDIARSVQEAARGTEMVTNNIDDVREGAGHTGAAASQVLSAAQELSRRSAELGKEVGDFLADIKAA